MKGYLASKKISLLVFLGCWIAYTTICITKNTYNSAIAAIISSGLLTKSQSGIISAGFYLTYGLGQLFGGVLVDKFSPFKFILLALGGSAVVNLIMSLTDNFIIMTTAWTLSGLLQFGMWPSIIRILSSVLIEEHRQKAFMYISFSLCFGTFLSYLIASIVLKNGTWPSLFLIAFILLVAVFAFFLFVTRKACNNMVEEDDCDDISITAEPVKQTILHDMPSLKYLLFANGVFLIFIPVIARTLLDSLVKSWMPTILLESFGASPSLSSALTMLVPGINLLGVVVISKLYPARIKNIMTAMCLIFVAAVPVASLLLMIEKLHIIPTVILFMLFSTIMYAGNQLMNISLPAFFAKYNKSATIAGIINALGCLGGLIATYGFGYLSDLYGWVAILLICVILCVTSLMFCLSAVLPWRRFTQRQYGESEAITK